ncbi:uncharacterized protein [Littorina saxatilis]|uniref:uncharacterized protein n=1 Tax=Littorina saxatilis TaxID=31220 RepID=UPI0038B51D9F
MTADPARGLEYYELDVANAKIKARKRLDYEYEPLRSVTLYLTANNGFCESETYSVRIDLTDVNEPPLVFPDETNEVDIERTVYEGLISFHPNVAIKDPDLDEDLKWVLKSPTYAFHVNATTGVIMSSGTSNVHSSGIARV